MPGAALVPKFGCRRAGGVAGAQPYSTRNDVNRRTARPSSWALGSGLWARLTQNLALDGRRHHDGLHESVADANHSRFVGAAHRNRSTRMWCDTSRGLLGARTCRFRYYGMASSRAERGETPDAG